MNNTNIIEEKTKKTAPQNILVPLCSVNKTDRIFVYAEKKEDTDPGDSVT